MTTTDTDKYEEKRYKWDRHLEPTRLFLLSTSLSTIPPPSSWSQSVKMIVSHSLIFCLFFLAHRQMCVCVCLFSNKAKEKIRKKPDTERFFDYNAHTWWHILLSPKILKLQWPVLGFCSKAKEEEVKTPPSKVKQQTNKEKQRTTWSLEMTP